MVRRESETEEEEEECIVCEWLTEQCCEGTRDVIASIRLRPRAQVLSVVACCSVHNNHSQYLRAPTHLLSYTSFNE